MVTVAVFKAVKTGVYFTDRTTKMLYRDVTSFWTQVFYPTQYVFGGNYVYNSRMITRHHIAPNRLWNCCSRIQEAPKKK